VTEREGVERCIAALTRHARLDSTGDETKAAMHIVVNWLQRTLDSAQRDTRQLADLLGANEQNLEEARAALAPADLDEMERIIAEQWERLPA
jgi:multidrug efflux pump subunit AcrA (membrane-fusion protein)